MSPYDRKAFEVFLYVDDGGKSPSTVEDTLAGVRRLRRAGVNIDQFVDDEDAAREQGRNHIAQLRSRGETHAVNNDGKVLNRLARFAGHHDLKFKRVRTNPVQSQAYEPWELERLLSYPYGRDLKTRRRRALVWAALYLGMRRGEHARMNVTDLDPENSRYRIRKPGKGGKIRWIWVEPELYHPKRPLMAYLRDRPAPPHDKDALWVAKKQGFPPRRMAYSNLGQEMWRIGKRVGVRANFQRARHYRASYLLANDVDIRIIQEVLGHSSFVTTARYATPTPESVERALKRALQRKRGRQP